MTKKFRKSWQRSGHFAQIYDEVLDSPAYLNLSVGARALLMEFERLCRPNINGSIGLSQQSAASRLRVSRNTAAKWFDELAEHGFIFATQMQNHRQGLARLYHLTTQSTAGARTPVDGWRLWRPGQPVYCLNSNKGNIRRLKDCA